MKIKRETAEKYWFPIGLLGMLIIFAIMFAIAYVWDEVDSTLGGFLAIVFVFFLYAISSTDGNSGGGENGGDGGG